MINEQTFQETNEFATSGTKVEPDAAKRVTGVAENEGYPYEHHNYYMNLLTKNSELFRISLESLLAEANNLLSGYNITPDGEQTDQILNLFKSKFINNDYIVYDQNSFNLLFEQVSANNYKIKDNIKNVYVKNLAGGYDISGIFTGGDTWAKITTNNCSQLVFESGAYINVGDTASYLEVNTDDAVLENVWIKGLGTTAVSVAQSFLLNANRVTFMNCKCSDRYSSSSFAAFRGSTTTNHNLTSKYIGCTVWSNKTTSTKNMAFEDCNNIDNVTIHNLSSDSNLTVAIEDCDTISKVNIYDCTGVTGFHAIAHCNNVNNVYIYNCSTTTGALYGIYYCYQVSDCRLVNLSSSADDVWGLYECDRVSNVYLENLSGVHVYGLQICNHVMNTRVYYMRSTSNSVYGFYDCDFVTGCEVDDVVASMSCYGYRDCNNVSGCKATNFEAGAVYGIYSCISVTGCIVDTISCTISSSLASGIGLCICVSACRVLNVTSVGTSNASGINGSVGISACYISNITASGTGSAIGISASESVSASTITNIHSGNTTSTFYAQGISSTDGISAVRIANVTYGSGEGEGIRGCKYISSAEVGPVTNSSDDYVDTDDAQITNKFSTPSIWT